MTGELFAILRTHSVLAGQLQGEVAPNATFREGVKVIAATVARGLASLPGIATPTEAVAALDAGANALKLFPAESTSPAVLKAMRAVLPKAALLLPVGGISPDNMQAWRDAGAAGFGFGSALYTPGSDSSKVHVHAKAFVTSLR